MRTAPPDHHLIGQVLDERADQRTRVVRARRVAWSGCAAVVGAIAVLGALLLAPGTSRPRHQASVTPPSDVVIAARDRSFSRSQIEIAPGTTVEWSNASSTRHHLVRVLGAATVDENLPVGTNASARFEAPGTYEYYCSIHPGMRGSITVVA